MRIVWNHAVVRMCLKTIQLAYISQIGNIVGANVRARSFICCEQVTSVVRWPAIVCEGIGRLLLGKDNRIAFIGNINYPKEAAVNLRRPHGVVADVSVVNVVDAVLPGKSRIIRTAVQVEDNGAPVEAIAAPEVRKSFFVDPDVVRCLKIKCVSRPVFSKKRKPEGYEDQ